MAVDVLAARWRRLAAFSNYIYSTSCVQRQVECIKLDYVAPPGFGLSYQQSHPFSPLPGVKNTKLFKLRHVRSSISEIEFWSIRTT